ncbi:uncharacterized protein RCC_06312 [Ramularia collo-cygni]|uniref:Wbp11/ELF5/Saf1 N-terminal domain-containing protein n=1 Tax=Ramularia collo-cygni TaxID=112498 RepID=A0A2D3USU0_9PEZI|nr:uncharacterized protein RCC_06312 [Ramularia collo-cygni]CZT20452.1 uncharacterized protein RCC_06312 [Ramularia collo-cygni]
MQAHRKAEKQKEINKNKKKVQAQRNEKLARRNPDRLQKQVDELKEADGRGGLRPKDKENLVQLEKDLKAVLRAREALGDSAPSFPSHQRRDGGEARNERRDRGNPRQEQEQRRNHLGKRRWNEEHAQQEPDDDSDTDPEVRDIPMPRDTPPPVPRKDHRRGPFVDPQVGPDGQRHPHALPAKPVPLPPAQVVYSSAPQLRDLKKEAVKFVPAAVSQQKRRVKGEGRLLEPEEIEKLEKAGYYAAQKTTGTAGQEPSREQANTASQVQATPDVDLDEEMRRFEAEMASLQEEAHQRPGLRAVQLEEVEDDGD